VGARNSDIAYRFQGSARITSGLPIRALRAPLGNDTHRIAFWKIVNRTPLRKGQPMTRILIAPAAFLMLLGLAACNNPYDPGQRAVGGALIGGASGAAIGAAAGGGTGAAIGAGVGAATGAVVGAATTPEEPPPPGYYYR